MCSLMMEQLEKEIAAQYDSCVLDASLAAVCFYERRGYKTVRHEALRVNEEKTHRNDANRTNRQQAQGGSPKGHQKRRNAVKPKDRAQKGQNPFFHSPIFRITCIIRNIYK